ncbi:hypothetical protein ACRTD6_18265 [Vibrio parahaemolyticus]|uniref:hypothetical protein n=1 Tax=Vibrio parahaemolyticus TaxID=670 RepID=UPI00226B543D|nr:hypothetical protein [Vibrio parahaemolyticus]MCX8855088.1 hypothetical protein [Vibrio parahaemolyticus]HCH2710455.1 hypothetical protein [Vibrio parahaemolyticus]
MSVISYAVIVENDESVWEDDTGSIYHFPKTYLAKGRITPGTKVLYYKSKMRNRLYENKRLSKEPHYFGVAEVSAIYEDPNSTKGDLFAEIVKFQPFSDAVPLKYQGKYFEKPGAKNYFRDAVRKIDQEVFERVIEFAGVTINTVLDKSFKYEARLKHGKSWTLIDDNKAIKDIDYTLVNDYRTRLPKQVRAFFNISDNSSVIKASFNGIKCELKVIKSVDKKLVERFDLIVPKELRDNLQGLSEKCYLCFEKKERSVGYFISIINKKAISEEGNSYLNKTVLNELVDLEDTSSKYFDVKGSQGRRAQRTEHSLVSDYCHFKGILVGKRNKIVLDDADPLFTDLYFNGCLYEAKSNSERSSIRMAIGQLYDYEHLLGIEVTKVIILPKKPTQSLLDLIHKLNFGLVYRNGQEFIEIGF